jgi:amino acid adenylation domain-containing protein
VGVSAALQLSSALSLRFTQDTVQSEALFFNAVAVLMARLTHRTQLVILMGAHAKRFVYDPEATFASLLQASDLSVNFCSNSVEEVDACVDSNAESGAANLGTRSVPSFRAYRGDSESWMLAVTGSAFSEDYAQRVLLYLRNLLEAANRDEQQPVSVLPLLDNAEALQLYAGLNATESQAPQQPVDALFQQQAAIDPAEGAVQFEGRCLSYGELDQQSDALAAILVRMGASQQHPVALAIPRSEKMPLVLLAALKAGSFFVPLDPTHPRQRLMDILEECKPAVVVVTTTTESLFAGAGFSLCVLDRDKGIPGESAVVPSRSLTDKAYMIYTSGTTGRPKGVMISHHSLANLILAVQREPGLRRGDRLLALATISFDIALMDMFLPIASGATLVVASEPDTRDPARISRLLEQESITFMQATPATWRMLVASGWKGKKGLRMLSGGEALPRDLAESLLHTDGHQGDSDAGELWNSYGPTETTIYSSFTRVRSGSGPVPIGPPLANTTFYIGDPAGNLLPPEVAGELYIGGDGVALGYYERPQLNSTKFIVNPWTENSKQRLFRTGDAACIREDGLVDFYGRLDSQVKLRGYRIELGEIESVLRTHPAVKDAAVVLREDVEGEPWLVAYLIASDQAGRRSAFDKRAFRDFVAERLPVYMLPSRFVSLDKLPLTGSGKIDKRALCDLPPPADIGENLHGETPINPTEAALLRVFREVLRSKSFGVDDNFFDYGGYSLLAVRLFARVANVLGIEVPITTLFEAPTVRRLAALLKTGGKFQTIVSIREGGDRAPFFLVQSYLLYGMAGSMVPDVYPVRGVREEPSHTRGEISFKDRVALYADAIQHSSPTGVIHLGGWCAAAIFTVEIARRLQLQGRTIGMLALFDAEPTGSFGSPTRGNPVSARLRAAWNFHRERLRQATWRGRIAYLLKRISRQPERLVELFYMRHRNIVVWLQRNMPYLPNVIFYNRWTQIVPVDQPVLAPIDAKIHLFRALDAFDRHKSDEAIGWTSVARGGVEVIFVPGDHETMFLEPQLSVLRQEFSRAMREVEA